MITRENLAKYLDEFLEVSNYQDYGPNGLQVQGQDEITKIVFSVSATQESIEYAVKVKAQALIVHHGLFWKFHGAKPIVGAFAKRVIPLIKNNINLFGYHLPLDAHLQIGNASTLAKALQLENIQPFGNFKGMPTGVKGHFTRAIEPNHLTQKLEKILDHTIIHSSPNEKPISSLGIITGGANSHWRECLDHNIDAYLTGEISEHDWHEAKESGVHFFAGGHHATERPGIKALMEHLQKHYKEENLEMHFLDSQNPA